MWSAHAKARSALYGAKRTRTRVRLDPHERTKFGHTLISGVFFSGHTHKNMLDAGAEAAPLLDELTVLPAPATVLQRRAVLLPLPVRPAFRPNIPIRYGGPYGPRLQRSAAVTSPSAVHSFLVAMSTPPAKRPRPLTASEQFNSTYLALIPRLGGAFVGRKVDLDLPLTPDVAIAMTRVEAAAFLTSCIDNTRALKSLLGNARVCGTIGKFLTRCEHGSDLGNMIAACPPSWHFVDDVFFFFEETSWDATAQRRARAAVCKRVVNRVGGANPDALVAQLDALWKAWGAALNRLVWHAARECRRTVADRNGRLAGLDGLVGTCPSPSTALWRLGRGADALPRRRRRQGRCATRCGCLRRRAGRSFRRG